SHVQLAPFLTRKVDDLKPHPANARIYNDAADDAFVEQIRKDGRINDPLIITWDNCIIAGHRRHDAAKKAGLTEVPVVVSPLTDPYDILEALVKSNSHTRKKTNVQKAREGKALMQVEKEKARRRQQDAGKSFGRGKESSSQPESQLSETFHKAIESGRAS